jgi:hypothetical protein
MKVLLTLIAAILLPRLMLAATGQPVPFAREPITITNAGEYYLTNDFVLTNSEGLIAIDITTSNVTLNLNGFVVRHLGSEDIVFTPRTGIRVAFNSVVRNGRVRGWSDTGILLTGYEGQQAVGSGGAVDRVGVSECGDGIRADGARLSGCLARDCAGAGFSVSFSDLRTCLSRDNETGYHGDASNSFTRCRAFGNVVGFELEEGNTLDRCISQRNISTGITLPGGSGTVIRNTLITRNGATGIFIHMDAVQSLIENNRLVRNGFGPVPLFGAVIVNGQSVRVAGNRFLRNNPNTIVDNGVDTEVVDNIFRPAFP